MHSDKITLKRIYAQYQSPGKFDSKELSTACQCQILAYKMGLGKVTVKMGFNAFDPTVTTSDGTQYLYREGELYQVRQHTPEEDYSTYSQDF